jgi:hypothetical protein
MLIGMRDDERCTAMGMSGGRGYVAHRCNKRALPRDPDGLCRVHRLEQEGSAETDVAAEQRWRMNRATERRLAELARHLKDFFDLTVELEHEYGDQTRPCTGRLLADPDDLLRVLNAQDLMPYRGSGAAGPHSAPRTPAPRQPGYEGDRPGYEGDWPGYEGDRPGGEAGAPVPQSLALNAPHGWQ